MPTVRFMGRNKRRWWITGVENMRFVDIIEKKRQKEALTTEEIQWWIQKYTAGEIPDYQVSALLMAIVLRCV